MRLIKIQKLLKEKLVQYNYDEKHGCADINFTFKESFYSISEYTGNRGNTPIGLLTNFSWNGKDGRTHKFDKQEDVCELVYRILHGWI